MFFSQSPKMILVVGISIVFISSTANYSSASDNTNRVVGKYSLDRAGSGYFIDTTAWIDSLKKVIAKKYTWGSGGPAVMHTQKRYIRANTTLADYYAKKFYRGDYSALALAEKYYGNVAFLTSGTDGDITDDISLIKLRDETAKKLMRLYLSFKPDLVYRQKLYKLLRANGGILRNESAATRDKVSKYIFKSTLRFFFDTGLPKNESGREVSCYVNPFSSLSSKTAKGTVNLLDSFATVMKAKPELRLKVSSLSSRFTMMEQQVLWDISNFAISYLVEKQGIAADRFLFIYNMDDSAANTYKGMDNLPVLTLGFAEEGEEGPSMVPPPMPNLRKS